jgi:hypothetical protein
MRKHYNEVESSAHIWRQVRGQLFWRQNSGSISHASISPLLPKTLPTIQSKAQRLAPVVSDTSVKKSADYTGAKIPKIRNAEPSAEVGYI